MISALSGVVVFACTAPAGAAENAARSVSVEQSAAVPGTEDKPLSRVLPARKLPSSDELYYSEPSQLPEPEPMLVRRPPFAALISVDDALDPFQLDATSALPVSLGRAADMALENNLAIKISSSRVLTDIWRLRNAYSGFLPNCRLGFMYDYLQGNVKLPFALTQSAGPLHLATPFVLAQSGVNYNVFQGGKVLFGALQRRNMLRATRSDYNAVTNDVLLEVATRYYNLVLGEATLQIRIQAVETSREQLRLNTDLERNGKATRLDVLQAVSQLAGDRQNLIEQQIARRNAAIQLSEYLNADQSSDMVPANADIKLVRLVAPDMPPGKLLTAAAEHRPELKSYRQRWLAAKRGIMVAAAPLFPTVQLSATEYGIGETLDNSKNTVVLPVAGTATAPAVQTISRQIVGLGVIGLNANWNLQALGLADYSNVQAARAQARQAMLQSNQQVNAVISQVRQSYLNQLGFLRRSAESLTRVTASTEELRLARLRLEAGLGKNIDVLRAQQDLTEARLQYAQAVINFNLAQVRLLHDLGMISRTNLVSNVPLKW